MPQQFWGVHVSRHRIEDYGAGLIAPETPHKLKKRLRVAVVMPLTNATFRYAEIPD
ncbi:hypothetical protein [Moorena sp. SIO4G3]|uniref:hypothetical protein n=1 Tax=Moorena sp. SIO4G3 TaxID=2607821 RepID=UPI00142A5770|nr:hypothetical protein [Moorena sp. SIO4G3]NEO75698.1 hypothetical protein [Moorena sp. SIO4G3]